MRISCMTPASIRRVLKVWRRSWKRTWRTPDLLKVAFHVVRIIKTTWKATLRRSGVRHVRFHDLRHTFNTRLMEAGVMQEIRMALMGHSSGSKVHSTYTHIELPVKREAIRKLETWINQQSEQLKKEQDSNASNETERTEAGPSQG